MQLLSSNLQIRLNIVHFYDYVYTNSKATTSKLVIVSMDSLILGSCMSSLSVRTYLWYISIRHIILIAISQPKDCTNHTPWFSWNWSGGWMGWLATHHKLYSFINVHQNCFQIQFRRPKFQKLPEGQALRPPTGEHAECSLHNMQGRPTLSTSHYKFCCYIW